MSKKERVHALATAIRLAGGQSELERKLKAAGDQVSQSAISLWLKGDGTPERWALPIARVVNFQVTPHELNERQYPNKWDALPVERARPLILEFAA